MPKIDSCELEDGEIVREVIDGKVNAFEKLLERHGGSVTAIVKKHVPFDDVEDTLQEVFLRAYRSLPPSGIIAVRTCH